MQRRLRSLLSLRRCGLACADVLLSAQRAVGGGEQPGGPMENEDPAAVLKQLQDNMRKRSISEGKEIPPAPRRRSGKTMFFEDNSQAGKDDKNSEAQDMPQSAAAGSRAQFKVKHKEGVEAKTTNPFLQKLTKMEADTRSTSFPTYDAAAEGRRKKIDAKIKAERSKMLVFRDVGMDLDKPILSRDVFLVFKYFRYGMEFAVDNELERMLRYFNEHAMNELKIIQDSKLMRGPPSLSRKRRHAPRPKSASYFSAKSVPKTDQNENDDVTIVRQQQQTPHFQISSLFPQIRCANTRQFCSSDSSSPTVAKILSTLLSTNHNASSFASFLPPAAVGENKNGSVATQRAYNAKDDSLFTVISSSMFRRPAVVIYSQLGQKFGSQADAEWRRLAYASICPGLVPYVPLPSDVAKAGKSGASEMQSPYGLSPQIGKGREGNASRASSSRAMPIDVISLRSADVYKYGWVQRMYVNRFAKSLSQQRLAASTAADAPSVTEVNSALIASTTFVGSQLLEPFYTTLGLRNYLLPHVMLVDHEGVIRWLSGGCPDANEKAVFASLLRQLEVEYYKAAK